MHIAKKSDILKRIAGGCAIVAFVLVFFNKTGGEAGRKAVEQGNTRG
jgi:hypothetical protein